MLNVLRRILGVVYVCLGVAVICTASPVVVVYWSYVKDHLSEPQAQISLVMVLALPLFHGIQWLLTGRTKTPEKILDWCFRERDR